jgi:hypothetical protein
MPVAEAQARISEPEFHDWMEWFAWRHDMAERASDGRPAYDPDDADDMTPAESAAHVSALFRQIASAATPTKVPHGR